MKGLKFENFNFVIIGISTMTSSLSAECRHVFNMEFNP